jgi:hypothetical protein|nr:MAG TPA: hypothetical protein [Caudoviricetes sp.]
MVKVNCQYWHEQAGEVVILNIVPLYSSYPQVDVIVFRDSDGAEFCQQSDRFIEQCRGLS